MGNLFKEIHLLVDWLHVFKAILNIFSNIMAPSPPTHAFLDFLWPVLYNLLFQSHWLLSHITNVEILDRNEFCYDDNHQSAEKNWPIQVS